MLSGFELEFSSAMNAATAGNASNYQLGWTSTKKVKKKVVTILHPVAFRVQYSDSNDSVSLLLSGKQAFAQGRPDHGDRRASGWGEQRRGRLAGWER